MYFAFDSTDSTAKVKQINAGWAWEIVFPDNKFIL